MEGCGNGDTDRTVQHIKALMRVNPILRTEHKKEESKRGS